MLYEISKAVGYDNFILDEWSVFDRLVCVLLGVSVFCVNDSMNYDVGRYVGG